MNTEQALAKIEPQVAAMKLFDFHTHAKAVMIKKALSRVLAEKVELGRYNAELALHAARTILYRSRLKIPVV